MKKAIILLVFAILVVSVRAQNQNRDEAEIAQIKAVIQSAYVEGLQNEGDFTKIDRGFHPAFELLIPDDNGGLKKYSLTEWKEKIKANLATGKMPKKGDDLVSVKFLFVDVTGNTAVAKFEFYIGTKLTFVDYQFLYKYKDGWKIVSKIYHKF
jgi:hypothetical protein